MAEVVDSIIAELILKSQGYAEGFDQATAAHGRFRKSVDQLKGQTFDLQVEGRKYKAGSDAIASSEEQATQRIVRTRKARADGASSAAATEKQAAKEASAAVTAAEKEKQAAISASEKALARAAAAQARFQEQQSKRAQARYYASGPELFEAKAREFSAADAAEQAAAAQKVAFADKEAAAAIAAAEKEKQAALAATERAMARAQVASDRFVAAQTKAAEKRFYAMGPEIFEAKAREFAAAGAASEAQGRRPLNISSPVLTKAAGFENGQNPFQGAADAVGGISAAQSAEMRATTAAIAENEIKAAAAANDMTLAEAEANDLAIILLGLKAKLVAADKEETQAINDQLFAIRQITAYQSRGLTEAEAQVKVEAELLAIQERRARVPDGQGPAGAKRGGLGATNEFALNASGGRFGYSLGGAALAGTAVFAGAAIATEAIESSTKLAEGIKRVSDVAGISAEGLQVYQHAAAQVGVSQDQFNTALTTLIENLGKARTGSQEQVKLFTALGVSIKTGVSAGDLLPTLIDRISSIKDPAQRARVEVGLFGETGQKLDQVLSGGVDKINDLAKALQDTGQILSSGEIAKLDETAKKLAEVKAQLQVDFAKTVADNAGAIEKLAAGFGHLVSNILHLPTLLDNVVKRISQINGAYAKGDIREADRLANAPLSTQPTDANGNPIDAAALPKDATGKPVLAGSVNQKKLDNLGTSNGPKGAKGKSLETLQNEADERTRRFNDLMARYQDELGAQLAHQNSDEEQRRDFQRQKIRDDERKQIGDGGLIPDGAKTAKDLKDSNGDLQIQALRDIRNGADRRLTNARLAQAIAAEYAVTRERLNVVNLQSYLSKIQRMNDAANATLEFKNQQLQDEASLARTASDRRSIELKILANQQEIAKNDANTVLRRSEEGDSSITKAQVDAANRTLTNLPVDTASKTASIDKQTQGPFASYVDSLPRTANDINEAFQKAAVSGIGSLNDALTTSIEKMTGLHGLAGQILGDFIKIAIQAAEARLLGDGGGAGVAQGIAATVGGNSSSGGSSGFFGTLLSTAGRIFGLSGARAGGGPVNPNGTYLVGEKGPELLQMGPQGGNIVPNNALGAMNVNTRAATPQVSGPVISQTIQYSGAVDIADKGYVNQMGAALYSHTQQAVAEGGRQTLEATPRYTDQHNKLK